MKNVKSDLKDVLFAGILLFLVYFLVKFYLKTSISIADYLWFLGFFWGLMIYIRGFDINRVIHSFTLTFIAIVSFIYVFLIILIRIPGVPEALALALTPFLIVCIIGFIKMKIIEPVHRMIYKHKSRGGEAIHVEGVKDSLVKSLIRYFKHATFKIDPIMWVFVIASLIILIVFLVIPLLLILFQAFNVDPFYANFYKIFRSHLESPLLNSKYVRLTLLPTEKPWSFEVKRDGSRTLVISGVNYGILLNSLINAAVVTTVSTILGIVVAFILARYNFPGKNFVRIIATVPLFVTPFVNAYVVKILFSENGPLSYITRALFGYSIRIQGLAGVAIAQIMAFYPIVYLNAYSSFINIDPSMEEQAENLGAKGLKLFFTVTLPLALPGIVAGSIIVFIFSLEDLGAPIVFQYPNLISYQIYSSFTSETGFVSPEMAALGIVLLFLSVIGFIAIRNYVSMRTYAMISRGGRWLPREHRLRLKGLILIYFILLPLIIFTAMPQICVILLAFNIMPPYGFSFNLENATLDYFTRLFNTPDIFTYIRNTLIYSTIAVVLAVTISVMVAYSVSRVKMKGLIQTLDTLATIPLAIPGLVVALGYVFFFSKIPVIASDIAKIIAPSILLVSNPSIYTSLVKTGFNVSTMFGQATYNLLQFVDPMSANFQAWILLIIAYSIRKLPFVVRSVYAGFQQVHEALEEAALNLGASRTRVIFGVILPFIATYIVSGAVIGFIYISTEVSTSITIGGIKPEQAPMTFYMQSVYRGGTVIGPQIVASMGVILILIQLVSILLIVLVFKQRYAFIGA